MQSRTDYEIDTKCINHASSVQSSTSKVLFSLFTTNSGTNFPFTKVLLRLLQVTMSYLYFVKSRRNAIVVARVVTVVDIAVVVDIAEASVIAVTR